MSGCKESTGNEEHAADSRQDEKQGEIEKAIERLKFDTGKSIRYLTKRKRFFDNWHYFLVATTALSGSSAFFSLLSSNGATLPATILTGIVAVASAVDLAINFSRKSHLYDSLQRRFTDLLSKAIRVDEPTEKNLKELEIERLEIEKDEPPTLVALEIFCRNEELQAQGMNEHMVEFDWFHRLFMHWWSFDGWGNDIAKRNKEKEKDDK